MRVQGRDISERFQYSDLLPGIYSARVLQHGRRTADLLSQIDAVTVRLLQSRARGVSERDLSFLRRKQNSLFKYINCQRERDAIWHRMERIQLPIPTLKTFFQDILFLDVGRSVMR